MGLETSKKEGQEPIIIEIIKYDRIETLLSKIIIPFADILKSSKAPDIYFGYEKIPFEKRNPTYKSIMRQEFANAMRSD